MIPAFAWYFCGSFSSAEKNPKRGGPTEINGVILVLSSASGAHKGFLFESICIQHRAPCGKGRSIELGEVY
jgi:hypothetical protein